MAASSSTSPKSSEGPESPEGLASPEGAESLESPEDTGDATETVPRQGSLPQAIAVLTGVLLTLLGGLGMLTTGFSGFAVYSEGVVLFGLSVNPLQNLLHLAAGLAGIVLSKQLRWTRRYGLALGVGSLVAFGFGAVAVYNPTVNVLNVDWLANWLHLVLAVIGLAIVVAPARRRVSRRPRH